MNNIILQAISTLSSVMVDLVTSSAVLPFVGLLIAAYIFGLIFHFVRR